MFGICELCLLQRTLVTMHLAFVPKDDAENEFAEHCKNSINAAELYARKGLIYSHFLAEDIFWIFVRIARRF